MRTRTESRMMLAVNVMLLSAVVSLAGCRTSRREVASGATPVQPGTGPSPTDVGPVPGGQGTPKERTDPYLGNPVALQDGRRLFNWYNCSGCHGGHAGGGMGPSLRDRTWIYGDRDDQIFDSIAEGRSKGMPAWGSKIPENQIWELVAYIKSMRTPAEPDPPVEPPNEQTHNPNHNTPLGTGPHQH